MKIIVICIMLVLPYSSSLFAAPQDLPQQLTSCSHPSNSTEAAQIKSRDMQDEYEHLVKVAKKFLHPEKLKYAFKTQELVATFKYNYAHEKQSFVGLTLLSARARIHVLYEIIKYKLSYMPKYVGSVPEDFRNLKISNKHWSEIKTTDGGRRFKDEFPAMFIIGDFVYLLVQTPTANQNGDGQIIGLIRNKAITYAEIYEILKAKSSSKLAHYSKLLLQQKRDGRPIKTGDRKDDQLLNGLNLLLDYEIARNMVNNGYYRAPPIIAYLLAMTNLENFKELIIQTGERVDAQGDPCSLVRGSQQDIEQVVRELLPNLQHGTAMRHYLRKLHQQDEESGDEYSDDEAAVKSYLKQEKTTYLQEHPNVEQSINNQPLAHRRREFLNGVTAQYIEDMRHAWPQGGKIPLWGGDLEVGAIAILEDLNIIIYQPGIAPLIINPSGTRAINLWLAGSHYQPYDPFNKVTTPTPSDGNCLFYAVLRAMRGPYAEVDIDDVEDLRNQVADYLAVQYGMIETVANNPIANRFAVMFNEEADNAQLAEAIAALPPGHLLDEAIALLPPARRTTAIEFQKFMPSVFQMRHLSYGNILAPIPNNFIPSA